MLLASSIGGAVSSFTEAEGAVDISIGFPAPISAIPFGTLSHWLQPWRALSGNRSFTDLAAGMGVVIGGYSAQQDALDMLRQHGFRHVRLEIPWGSVDPRDETRFTNQAEISAFLARLQQAELRPLILLNANDGGPCPAITYDVELLEDAPAGARTVMLVSTDGLVAGRSGFKHFPRSPLASVLVTGIVGQQVTLSRPLPAAVPAGQPVPFVTLSYEPFSQPGSLANEQTMQGWLRYVDLTCQTAITALGSADLADRGFDLEIWNELSFGSKFLSINNYCEPAIEDFHLDPIMREIVKRTADQIAAAGTKYQGVRISDGFGNTIPWTASSQEPARVSAISKHPYPPSCDFPKDQQAHSVALDATGRKTRFIPSYKAYFPEYYANVIQTETLCRDLSNQTNPIYGVQHGRLARVIDGQVSPVDIWITELGCTPKQWNITDPAEAQRLMTAFALRSLFFYLPIGGQRVYLFEAFGAPGSLGLVDQSTPTTPSAPLLSILRLLTAIKGDTNGEPGVLVPITATALRGPSDLHLFDGDGTPNLPPMTTADCLVLLPIQVSPTRFAIIYYVMTRDILVPLGPQNLRVSIQSANIQEFSAQAYDPIADQSVPVENRFSFQDRLELDLSATDTPRVLLLSSAA